MTEYDSVAEARELLRQCLVPTILGNGPAAHFLALRLYIKYGCPSMLCGRRKGLSDLLDPFSGFLKLYHSDNSRLAAEQLVDFADGYEDCVFLLIPMKDTDRHFIHRHSELLESRYISADPRSLLDALPFGRIGQKPL